MRLLFTLLFTIIFCTAQSQIVPHEKLPSKPANARPILDNANLLSDEEERLLVNKLVAYNDSTSNQIVIVTVATLEGYEADQYATELGHYWGVGGQSQKDNGVVILVSTGVAEGGKRKVFIATGYGLEGALPAITCKKIVDYEMKPSLKSGNFYTAFDNAINAIIKAAAGEYKAPDGYKKQNKKSNFSSIFKFIFIIIIIIVFIIISNGRGGGGRGNVLSNSGLLWMLPSLLNSGGGGGGSGGNWGSNDSGGDSGGFGDFGGGDFGGGGAGGDW